MGSTSWGGYTVLAGWRRAWAVRSRQVPVPVLMMGASKAGRPAMAAQGRGR
jgi:hypothetical protein